jgi:hypothetical protein
MFTSYVLSILSQGSSYIASKFLLDPYVAEEEIPTEFMNEFVTRFDGDGLDEVGSLYLRR